jgi:hypothetical protein
MAASGFTPISLYYSTTAAAAPTSGNLVNGELAINITDGKLYYKDNTGTVKLLASSSGAAGDVVGPASATDNAIARFDGTTGKIIQNSVVTIADTTGDMAGVGTLNATTLDTTNLEVTNIKAKDGTASASIADSTGAFTVSAAFAANGGTTLGDASGDALTINSSAVSIPNGLNFDSNTFVIDATNNRTYIGASSLGLTTTAVVPLFMVGQMLAGASNTSVNTSKDFRLAGGAYTNNAATIINFSGQSGANTINYGGATGAGEPATTHIWYTGTVGTAGAGSERMRIDSSGNVLVGTTSGFSNARFDVRDVNRTGNTTNAVVLTTTAQAADIGGTLGLGGLFDGSSSAVFGSIRGGKENATSGNYSGYLSFGTVVNSGLVTERMRITSAGGISFGSSGTAYGTSGQVLTSQGNAAPIWTTPTTGTVTSVGGTGSINGLSLSGTVTTTGNLTLGGSITSVSTSGNFQMNSLGVGTAGSATAGEIRATNNITAYYSSDRKLKENIQDVDNALDKVCSIGSKTFDWTDEYIAAHGGEDAYFMQKSDFGVIAQDVQSVFPQAVRTREDGTLAVDYEKLSTLAFGAIKELVKRIEALEVR